MKRPFKIFIITTIFISSLLLTMYIFGFLIFGHFSDFKTCKNYLYLFKDSARYEVESGICSSSVRKKDIYNIFNYRDFHFIIWEFKDLNIGSLDQININQNIIIKEKSFNYREILDPGSEVEVHIKYLFSFKNDLTIDFDELTKIDSSFVTPKYIGFYGIVNKIYLGNGKGNYGAFLNFSQGKKPAVLLVYKGPVSLFLILIFSDEPFDLNIINILNLT